jgi:hypothetical protein
MDLSRDFFEAERGSDCRPPTGNCLAKAKASRDKSWSSTLYSKYSSAFRQPSFLSLRYGSHGITSEANFHTTIFFIDQLLIFTQGDTIRRNVRATISFPFTTIARHPKIDTFGLDEGCLWKIPLDLSPWPIGHICQPVNKTAGFSTMLTHGN